MTYEKPNGETVLCDLKTSSGIRWQYRCQLSAYANAIQPHGSYGTDTVSNLSNNNKSRYPIDDLCIVRLHPDSKEFEIEWESDFNKSRSAYMDEFYELRDYVVELVNDMDAATNSSSTTEVSA